jgi:hypothetical protein
LIFCCCCSLLTTYFGLCTMVCDKHYGVCDDKEVN